MKQKTRTVRRLSRKPFMKRMCGFCSKKRNIRLHKCVNKNYNSSIIKSKDRV